MIQFDTFYMQCPNCQSCLEGQMLKSEMVNQSLLYSDGKTLNDNYITELQRMVICPACGHWFWVDNFREPLITKEKPSGVCYSWNSWRFYGVHFASNEGKMALINHYRKFLEKGPYNIDKEIYFRRFLWWAYNDLIRNHYQVSLKYLFSGEMSFNVWRKNRNKLLKGFKIFREHQTEYLDNLQVLLGLLKNRYTPDDEKFESINLEIIEINRELHDFEKAKELLAKTTRRTYYIAHIEKKVKNKDSMVFLVTG